MTTEASDPSAETEWRIHWSVPVRPQPGLPVDAGEEAWLWAGSTDPEWIRTFAEAQRWPADKTLRVSIRPVRAVYDEPSRSVVCHPGQIAEWRPDEGGLPAAVPGLRIAVDASSSRLDFLHALQGATTAAVAAGVLDCDDAVGLALLAREALTRVRRRRVGR